MANQTLPHTDSQNQCQPDVAYFELTPENVILTRKGKVLEFPRHPQPETTEKDEFLETTNESIDRLSKFDDPVIKELVVKIKKIQVDYLDGVSREIRNALGKC